MLREKCQGCLGRTLIPVAGLEGLGGQPFIQGYYSCLFGKRLSVSDKDLPL